MNSQMSGPTNRRFAVQPGDMEHLAILFARGVFVLALGAVVVGAIARGAV